MMRWLLLLALIAAAPSCSKHRLPDSAVQQSDAELARPIDLQDPDYDALATAVERAANAARAQHGLAALQTNGVLRLAASRYAAKMVKEGFFAHEDPNTARLRTPQQRVAAAGGENPITAENLADVPGLSLASGEPFYMLDPKRFIVSRTPNGEPVPPHTYASYGAQVVEGWMNSPGHRRNLLASDALQQGIGAELHVQNDVPFFMVVQVFQVREELR